MLPKPDKPIFTENLYEIAHAIKAGEEVLASILKGNTLGDALNQVSAEHSGDEAMTSLHNAIRIAAYIVCDDRSVGISPLTHLVEEELYAIVGLAIMTLYKHIPKLD